MASSNTGISAQGAAFWERFVGLLVRDRKRQDEPGGNQRKGLAITIATLVSTLLWFTFSMRETYSVLVLLPTEVVNLPETEALRQLPPPTIRAQVEGEGLNLIRLRLNPPVVLINGERQEVALRDAVSEVLTNVRLESVSPSTFTLQKEERVTRKVPIELRAEIETPPEFDLVEPPRITPDSVEVSGAASVVEGITAWPSRPFRIDELRDSLVTRVMLSDTLSGLLARNLEATTLTAVAQRFTEGQREIGVTVTGEPSSQRLVTLEPATIRVRYRVLFSQYDEALHAMDFFATVSFDEIRSDTTGRVRPDVHLPAGVILRDVELRPPTLRYYQRIE